MCSKYFLMRQIVDGIRELMSEHSWAIDLRALEKMGVSRVWCHDSGVGPSSAIVGMEC